MKTPTINELNKELLQTRKEPNYRLVNDLVYYVHKYLSNRELPIDLSFIKNFKNLKIKTYSWFANINNLSIEETIEYLNSDSGCCWYLVEQNKYLILYNDFIDNPYHNRWTLAHELGHYLLKHNEICNTAVLGRNSIELDEYKIYEKEANAFARELLAPLNVLCCISDKSVTPTQIMKMCALSSEAAHNIISFANKGLSMGVSYFCESKTTKLFKKFIIKCKSLISCTNCNYTFSSLDAKFCPICGCNELIKGGDLKNKMKYECNYHLDKDGKINECPICHNEEISEGEYCKICGTFLINKCTNIIYDTYGNQIEGCGKIADPNARYCVYCGSETTFYKNNLLCAYIDYDFEQEKLNLFWSNIIEDTKSSGKIILYTNLINSTLKKFKDNTFTVNFNNLSPFSETILSKKENISTLKEIIKNKLGKDININFYDTQKDKYIYEEDTLPF